MTVLVICEVQDLHSLSWWGAGLMIKALAHLHGVDIGFKPNNLLSVKVPLEGPQYEGPANAKFNFSGGFLREESEAIPGVEAATISRGVPMNGWAGWSFVNSR